MNQLTETVRHSTLTDFIGTTTRLRIRTHAHPSVSLVAPIIGDDYIAGINEATGHWLCLRTHTIDSLICETEISPDLPKVRYRPISLSLFLREIPMPTKIQIDERTVIAYAIVDGWIQVFDERPRLISIDALEQLQIIESPDFALCEPA